MIGKSRAVRTVGIVLGLYYLSAHADSASDNLESVDPRIGVIGPGSCVIGPSLPFASIHPSPDTPDGGHDGYNPNRPIRGFSQLHVSGTGWGQYGNFLISPQVGLTADPLGHDSPKAEEVATPFQYQVRLTLYNILAQFTPARRAAIYHFTFPAANDSHVVIDAAQSIPQDIVPSMGKPTLGCAVTIGPDGKSISGMGYFAGGFSGPYKAYFYAEVDQSPTEIGTWKGLEIQPGSHAAETATKRERVGAYWRFTTRAQQVVAVKIGVSFLSVERARENLRAEIPGWDYAAVEQAAESTWSKALAAIEVAGGTKEERTLFYTALFHTMIMPRDRTGEFAPFDPATPMWDDHYAIWDTWRTLYPLLAVIRPDIVRDTVQSFIERQRVDHTVGDTFIAGINNSHEQGGNDVDMVIATAHANAIPGIDWDKAYAVIKYNADNRRNGETFDNPRLPAGPYRAQGWIPAGIMSCSFTLEYAYNDFVASKLAEALGHPEDASRYRQRSHGWEKLWNPSVESDGFKGFILPRSADGTWVEYDPKTYPGSWKNYFYEANSWTYSYFVPHQPLRLVELMGGKDRFIARLDHTFAADLLKIDNEPAFLTPQLYHYAGRPDLSSAALYRLTTELYNLRGVPGDDDSGAMSSYYIWVKLGLFPNAGQDFYYLNGPAFPRATVQRPGFHPLEISRTGSGIYIAKVTLDGRPVRQSWLRNDELAHASHLDFVMSDRATEWSHGAAPPPSEPAGASNP